MLLSGEDDSAVELPLSSEEDAILFEDDLMEDDDPTHASPGMGMVSWGE